MADEFSKEELLSNSSLSVPSAASIIDSHPDMSPSAASIIDSCPDMSLSTTTVIESFLWTPRGEFISSKKVIEILSQGLIVTE